MIVTMLTAKIETSVNSANARSAVNAPRIAVTPMASGRRAAAKLPKMSTSSTSRIGIEIVSARAMSALTRSLMSLVDHGVAADLRLQPGRVHVVAGSPRWRRASSPSSASCSTA